MEVKRAQNILVTGALGQVGSELVPALQERFGMERVVASDVRSLPPDRPIREGPFEVLDCTDRSRLEEVVEKYNVGTLYHLAAILSAKAEAQPELAWRVNMEGLYNVLEVARAYGCRVFVPSSIAAFGPSTPKDLTPQDTLQRPGSLYGVTKVAGELLCDYYALRFGLDVRGLRYPGLISYTAPPGGGNHRLRRGDLLGSLAPGQLYQLPGARYPAADDVHARCHPGHARADGSRPGPAPPP